MAEHSADDPQGPPLDDLFARLERERQEADELYNDALTALDAHMRRAPQLPGAPQASDSSQLPAVNERWRILPDGPPPGDASLKGRLRSFIWRLAGPPLERQQAFNAALVDHLNRSEAAQRQLGEAVAALIETLRRELDALERFEARLLEYLRTVTLYVDTKDRSLGGALLRDRVSLIEARVLALKRQLESGAPGRLSPAAVGPQASAVDAVTYVGFEDRYRGPQEMIRDRVEEYVPLFSGAADVLDVGCGRGELLECLRARGIRARGVDANAAMVELCRARGLDVALGDAVAYLSTIEDGSLGGLVAIQVVEHFEPAYLVRFLETAYLKLQPGAPVVFETINPACWVAFFESYIRDLTHQRPLHPDTLRYIVETSGFSAVDVRFRRPVPPEHRLDRVDTLSTDPALTALAAAVNAHADKLNARLFSSTDYAIVARR